MNDILLNVESKETRLAHLRGGQLHDLILDRKRSRQSTGNIYRGKVTNILHNIQSAFVRCKFDKNRVKDTLAYQISLTFVDNAFDKGLITEAAFKKAMSGRK